MQIKNTGMGCYKKVDNASKGQALAKEMMIFADDYIGAVSKSEFQEKLDKMERLSTRDLIKFIRSFDKDESILELICDEVSSNYWKNETVITEKIVGNYIYQGEETRYIHERQWACKKVLTALLNKANKLGIDTNDFEKQFLKELEHQFDSFGFVNFGFVNTKKLDKIIYALTQSIENRLNFTEEEEQIVKNTSVEEGQEQSNTIIENRLEKAYFAFGERVGKDGEMTDKYEVEVPVLDENGNPTGEFETKLETYDGQMQRDGIAADIADGISRIWGSKNTAAKVRKDLKIADGQLKELKEASLQGEEAYNAKFKEIFGIEYDYANILAYQKAEEIYINASQYHEFEMMFRRELKTLLSPAPLRDETETVSADPSTNVMITTVTATKEQVYEREFNKLATLLTQNDSDGNEIKGSEILNAELAQKGVANGTIEEKFEVLKQFAKTLSKALHSATLEAGGGKEFSAVQSMYDNSYKVAYGLENDIIKRVTDYNISQERGAGFVKMGTALLVSFAVAPTGIGLVGMAACTAGTTIATEVIDRGTSGRALNALREQGLGEYLDAVDQDVDWEATLKQAAISGGAVLIGGAVAKGVVAVMAGKSTVAQFAAMLGADVVTDVAWEFITTKQVTWQGVVFTVLLSSVANYAQIKQMQASDPAYLGLKMMEEDGIVFQKDKVSHILSEETVLTMDNGKGITGTIKLDGYDGSIKDAKKEIAKSYYDYKQSGLDIETYMRLNPTANPELPYLVSSSFAEARSFSHKALQLQDRMKDCVDITKQLSSNTEGPLTGKIKQLTTEVEDMAKQVETLRAKGKLDDADKVVQRAAKKIEEVTELATLHKTHPDIAQELLRVGADGEPVYKGYERNYILEGVESDPQRVFTIAEAKAKGKAIVEARARARARARAEAAERMARIEEEINEMRKRMNASEYAAEKERPAGFSSGWYDQRSGLSAGYYNGKAWNKRNWSH